MRRRVAGRLVARVQARGAVALYGTRSSVFCLLPGGCRVAVEGRTLVQGEASAGLGVRF